MILKHSGDGAPEHTGPEGARKRDRTAFVHREEPPVGVALANASPSIWPSPSQEAAAGDWEGNRERLASEVGVIWLDPAARWLPWLREGFWQRRPVGTAVKAYTVDGSGRVVRAFLARRDDLTAYAELQRKRCGTCPIEAVDPRTIRPAVPALPAHPGLLALQEGRRPGGFLKPYAEAKELARAAMRETCPSARAHALEVFFDWLEAWDDPDLFGHFDALLGEEREAAELQCQGVF